MSKLLESIKVGTKEVKNRIVMPPMCMYSASKDGKVRYFHRAHYTARAMGGVGMIVVEATAVEPRGRITDFDLGIWEDSQIKGHSKLVKECAKFGTTMVLQIAHAGRKSECLSNKSVGPDDRHFSQHHNKPHALSKSEIKDIVKKFIKAGKRAMIAGYDMVEIHAAHGYLIHEFLSPLTNSRDDKYGGSFENRARLLCQIMEGLNKEDVSFGVRISADEWEKGGFDIESSKKLSKILESFNAKFIHVSAGGNHLKPTFMPKIKPFYQCGYAKEIKSVSSIPVIAVGLINSVEDGDKLIEEVVCDMVAYGRELLRNPNLAHFAAVKFNQQKSILKQYQRAFL